MHDTVARAFSVFFLLALPAFTSGCAEAKVSRDRLDHVRLPDGFQIDLYAHAEGARSLTLSPGGTVFVGSRSIGNVYAIRDEDDDGRGDRVFTIASGLRQPNGVAFRDGDLYVAEISRIIRFESIEERLDDPPEPVVVFDGYPGDEHHGWKFIEFGPDGKLYVPVGAPCNVCVREDPLYASITRLDPDSGKMEIFAEGIRNTVGFDWHPDTGELWFTDNGRDRLGDDAPPDELNRAPEMGLHFGFPYCHGGTIADPEFGRKKPCSEFIAPERRLGPHVAALGMRFYDGDMFPAKYKGNIFIAEHGSWNRSTKIGYRVMLVDPVERTYDVFAEGWLRDGGVWGRPVDVLVMPDGALLVSDDKAGVIYRITYSE